MQFSKPIVAEFDMEIESSIPLTVVSIVPTELWIASSEPIKPLTASSRLSYQLINVRQAKQIMSCHQLKVNC